MLDVPCRRLLVVVIVLHCGIEEGRWRKLTAVSHDDRLPSPHDGAKGVHRSHLASLVEDYEVEQRQGPGR